MDQEQIERIAALLAGTWRGERKRKINSAAYSLLAVDDPQVTYLPTEDEIEEGCAAFQREWDDETRYFRLVRHDRLDWSPPVIHMWEHDDAKQAFGDDAWAMQFEWDCLINEDWDEYMDQLHETLNPERG